MPDLVPGQGRRGGKMTLTDDEIANIQKLAAVLNFQQICDFLGVGDTYVKSQMKDRPEVKEAFHKGRNSAIATVAKGLLQKALDGNLTAQIFYLKTQAGWREKESIELTGKDGGPIETKDMSDDPIGILSRRIVGIASRIRATEIVGESDGAGSKLLPP